jgi:hypothetical protein
LALTHQGSIGPFPALRFELRVASYIGSSLRSPDYACLRDFFAELSRRPESVQMITTGPTTHIYRCNHIITIRTEPGKAYVTDIRPSSLHTS